MTWLWKIFAKSALGMVGGLGGMAMKAGLVLGLIAMIFTAGIRWTHGQIKLHSIEIKEDQISGDVDLRDRHRKALQRKDKLIDELRRKAEASRQPIIVRPSIEPAENGRSEVSRSPLLTSDDLDHLRRLRE